MKKRSNRNKEKQQRIKNLLLEKHKYFCWLCEKEFTRQSLTIHHIIPHSISHTTEEKTSCILCMHCHFDIVNKEEYNSLKYNKLMQKAEQFRLKGKG